MQSMQSKDPFDERAAGEGADVFRQSPLVVRLIARGMEPIGAIDVRHPQHLHARASQWIAERFPLLARFMSRYGGQEAAPGDPAGFIYTRAVELPGQERGGEISPITILNDREKPAVAIPAAGFSGTVLPEPSPTFRVSRRPPAGEWTSIRTSFGLQSDHDAWNAFNPEHPTKQVSSVTQDTEMKTASHALERARPGNEPMGSPEMPPIPGKGKPVSLNRVSELREVQPPVEALVPALAHRPNGMQEVPAGPDQQKERADSPLLSSASDTGRYGAPVSVPVRAVSLPGSREEKRGRAEQAAPLPVRAGTSGTADRVEPNPSAPPMPGERKAHPPLRAVSQRSQGMEPGKSSVGMPNPDAPALVEERREFPGQQIPSMVWRKDSIPAREAQPVFPGRARPQTGSSTEQGLPDSESAPSSVPPPHGSPPLPAARSGGGDIDIGEIAEKVSQVIARKLIIERERRGVRWWR